PSGAFSQRTVLGGPDARQAMHGLHSRDITVLLQQLLRQGLLEKTGHGRGTSYHVPSFLHSEPSSLHSEPSSLHSER
ncbi:MAG: hypothetical protein ACNA8W_14785, partial [Bradymonadaceae bacterium]